MTLKQFFQVAGGIVVALLIYSSGMIGIIKWPLVVLSGLLGVALAFVPLEERPLERWIVAFFRSVYSPTLFFWKKTETPPVFFQEAMVMPVVEPIPTQVAPAPPPVMEIVPTITVAQPVIPPATPITEKRILEIPEEKTLKVKEPMPSREEPGLTIFPTLEEAEKSFLSKISSLFSFAASLPMVSAPQGSVQAVSDLTPEERIRIRDHKPIRVRARPEPFKPRHEEEAVESVRLVPVSPTFGAPAPKFTGALAQFSKDAAPPFPPSLPNVIVGQVMDAEGKIIEGAILEIKDSQGHPVRALRSNKLGHFMIVTPLPNARYQIEIDKEGFQFEPFTFETKGELIPPIAIKAKGVAAQAATPIQA
ncbi:MAG: hypothetical protein UX19_C0001G0001 [Candidatus Woesebacteria bacterium GW2011_GWA1_45_8]|uniref:Minus agglutinin n=1 Tax=Candidatus Woesebacteria bacterium GW2011_GWA1_45_8 TaxID=1618559 RepID=A0A0G1MW35_9BACT|nr:MAG: hypothetical protein UX19_C0001G0001 [Candidatus Woesebacteria bacterium GW2011_GWA1_45_8]